MPRTSRPTSQADNVVLPVDAYLELQAFHAELIGIAHTIDPTDAPPPTIRKHEQSRRRALAKVFRLWAEQIDRSLSAMRPA
ncbi:hypothetical protein [Lysobacter sp. Root690]|uniref:XAC0095 family protein n=1 Tax=Lysobacter sp. Root690 TaxID=1736588 RepID=UPI000AA3EE70|nr:hypothetical protein [Lysobacter sp. Root690]